MSGFLGADSLKVGEVVLIQSEKRNRGKWPLGVVLDLFHGRDGIVRAGKSFMDRPVQHLYHLELACDGERSACELAKENPIMPSTRPRRDATVAAELRIRDSAEDADF